MSATTFARTHDNFSTSVASPYSAGSGSLSLASGAGTTLGALPSGRVWRFTAGTHFGTRGEVILGVYEATGRTGDTLTGVTASAGYTDVDLPAGTGIQIRWTAKHAHEIQDAINVLESAPGVAIGAAISGGTAGRVLFEGTGGTLKDSADLTWDGSTLGLPQAFAIGPGIHGTKGDSSFAIGDGAIASGPASVALGVGATAGGSNAVAVGQGTTASGTQSFAFGYGGQATGNYSVSLSGTATGEVSSALGRDSVAGHDHSTALGAAATTTAPHQVMLGTAAETVVFAGPAAFQVASVRDAADDTAAAALSPAVPVGGLYRTGSILKIRVS